MDADERGISMYEWKAQMLNRLFYELGTAKVPGKITAATVRHGEIGPSPKPGENGKD